MSSLNFVLRSFLGNWETDEAVAKTIRYLRKGCFQGIMLWWTDGHWVTNHVRDEEMKRLAARVAKVAPRFRSEGFSVGLNVHTIGFSYSPPDTVDFGFQYQVLPNGLDGRGTRSRRSACPLSPTF